jgi:hypothetical protein
MQLSKRVALEEITEEWQHMTEFEKDLLVLQVFIMFDKRARWLLAVTLLATLIFLAVAIIYNLPAPVFISLGFALGILTVLILAFVILTIIKRR